jgi:hypothetical protein
MRPHLSSLALLILFSLSALQSFGLSSRHPCLTLTAEDAALIRENLGKYPLFDADCQAAVTRVGTALKNPIDVPQPKDAAGYTHERHKRNYLEMHAAGFLYQITGDTRYSAFVKAQLDRYAELYPTLGKHPAANKQAYGRIFWQSLNETVWLVHVAQAYDCVYDALAPADRERYEKNIFRPMTDFLVNTQIEEFDRIHNHGTWTATAVGMIGYVMGDEKLVRQALRGSKMDGEFGYLRQIDLLFSPDGFYCEGPYYARYALMPFFLFAQVIDNNQPEMKIFEYRGGLLGKALDATLQQSWTGGAFLPINDALKEKTWHTAEMVLGVNLTYARLGRDARLLSIAREQGTVSLGAAGLEVARAIATAAGPLPAYPLHSAEFSDGSGGKSGGLALLRSGPNPAKDSLAALKYTAFGMEHGHYDKLQFIYYDNGREIIPDYGAARYLNVEQKFGGRYLPENKTYAKQTVAHNTLVVDETTQYGGSYATAENAHADRHYFDAGDSAFQVASARDTAAYPGVAMQRTTAMVRDARLEYPIVVDVLRAVSDKKHRYDLPFHYEGIFLAVNAGFARNTTALAPLGKKHGYQHLWLEGSGETPGPVRFTWMNGSRFYTLHTAAESSTKLLFTLAGANDPNFNLRPERALILRRDTAGGTVFASVIEPHGDWNGTTEVTHGGTPVIEEIRILAATDEGTVIRVTGKNKLALTLMFSNRADDDAQAAHTLAAGGETFTWKGNAAIRR